MNSRIRTGLVLALVIVLGIAAFAGLRWRTSLPAADGPIVLVSIDTLRADRLPLYGYAQGRTPALDALAGDSVVFNRAYAHAPQTLPSHASMFTGLLPFEHKVRDNFGFALGAGAETLASLVRRAGYRTGAFVSSYVLRADTGVAQGFDTYNAEFPAASVDRSPGQVQRAGPETLKAATSWLDGQADPKFFLFFHIYEPHKPYAPPDRFRSGDLYDGEVSYSDEIVGGLIDVLKRKGWYDAGTIVVTADHGEGLGDHGEQEHGLFVYDETIRVPWIVKLAGGRAGGSRVSAPVQHIDLVPTFAAIAGFAPPDALRGRNILPAALGEGTIAAQGIYSEALYPRYHFGWSELLSLTDERYRYIKAPREELYDLERDPDERQNLAGERLQAAAALRSGLESLVAGRGIDAPSAVSAEDRERLAALGYVGTQSPARTASEAGTLPDPKDKTETLRKYRDAVERIGAGQLAEGAALLRDILRTDPQMTDVWSQLARVLTRIGRHDEAFSAYQEMIRLSPDEPSGPLGASSALVALGRLDEARAHAELAVRQAPAAAHEALAKIAVSQKQYDAAVRHADAAQQADPSLPLPAYVRGMIEHAERRFPRALPHLMQAREGFARRAVQPSDLHFLIGDSLARLERYAEAEPFLGEEVRLYPQNIRARAGLAMLYQATGRSDAAAKAIDAMIRESPTPAAYDTAAQLWRMFGDAQRAAAMESASRRLAR
jgi:choline-sulfatase